MTDAALTRISHIIKVEEDLSKISTLKQQFTKEKGSVDVRLNSTTQVQIDAVMENLTKLNVSATKLNSIKSSINQVNQSYDESVTNIPNYNVIKEMTAVNEFFNQVLNLYTDISNFKAYIDHICQLIEEELDAVSGDITYPLPNIFSIHYNMTQVRNFQDYLETHSQNLSDDMKSIIMKIVAPVKKAVRSFDELLKESVISLTEALKEGNEELVFKIIKIIEFERCEDAKYVLSENLGLLQSNKLVNSNYANYRGSRRNYHKLFYDKLEESLVDTFSKCVEHFEDDKMLVYDNLNWLEDELVFVVESLSPFFPPHWDINTFIENVYYNNLHKFTMEIIKSDPPAEDLLKILAYDAHYTSFINALHTSPGEKSQKTKKSEKKEQRSIIGEELKDVVLDDYMRIIVGKMEEWNENLASQETTTFVERGSPPDIYTYHQIIEDEDAQDQLIVLEVDGDVFVLPDFKTPLSMLKEQADVAAESGYSKILVGVIENWSKCYIKRAENYQKVIEEEFDKYMSIYNNQRFLMQQSKARRFFRRQVPERLIDIDNMPEEELAKISRPGLIEYLTALGNTYEINTDRLQDKFLPNYLNQVHTNYQTRIEAAFRNTLVPSTELNASVIRTIVDIIINDLYPALSTVFSKAWYDDNSSHSKDEPKMAERIVETIAEYMEELRSYASYDIYSVTFNILLDTFIAAYIRIGYENILHGSAKKIDPTAVKKYKSFSEAVGRDVTVFYGGLESLFTRKDSAYLLISLRAIEFLGDLATCEDPMTFIPQMWENEILGSFYYCSVEYIRGICLCRKDMDKSMVNQLIPQLVAIQKEFHANVEPTAIPVGTLSEFFYNQ